MKVIFLKNMKGVGQIGEIRNVSDGYARNFLIPRGIASPAHRQSVEQAANLQAHQHDQLSIQKEKAEQIALKLANLSIQFKEESNTEGSLYGSVDQYKIAQQIHKQTHILLSEEQIILDNGHIKHIGEQDVKLVLHPDVMVNLKVIINPK